VDHAFLGTLERLEYPLDVFAKVLPTIGARPLNSDVVELRHCHLAMVNFSNYSAWAIPTLYEARPRPKVFMIPEITLGLLEMYATQKGFCDFAAYPLQISYDLSDAEALLRSVPANDSLPRFAFVIIAFKDAVHLERLIKAVHLPHHYIILHLERSTSPSYAIQVRRLASQYRNIAVVEFGTIIYPTDSISMINYQIMNWLVNDLKLEYDYHFTLGGATYPLYSASELARHLQTTKHDVWLGEILDQGKSQRGDDRWKDLILRKRFIFTTGRRKYQKHIKKVSRNGFVLTVPDFITSNMTTKTNSGNQGVFSYKFVKELTNSPQVKELFAIAKYGCCCCLEERTWIAAAGIIGYQQQALEAASMFQLWGGGSNCEGTLGNAVLSLNASFCFLNEDASENSTVLSKEAHIQGRPFYFPGNEMLDALKDAKKRGLMFARKFDSGDPRSVELLGIIQSELHQN